MLIFLILGWFIGYYFNFFVELPSNLKASYQLLCDFYTCTPGSNFKSKLKFLTISLGCSKIILYQRFLNYMDKRVEKISNDSYVITFPIENKLYKIVIDSPRGANNIMLISDENSEDVTDLILPYIGPNKDWFGNENLTPNFFNRKILYFECVDSNCYKLEGDEKLVNLF